MNKTAKQSAGEDPRLVAMTTLLMLQADARQKDDMAGLAFLMANETHRLVPYRQCVFWTYREGKVKIDTISGLTASDENAPYLVWLEKTMAQQLEQNKELQEIAASDIDESRRTDWQEWCARHVLMIPFKDKKGNVIGGLWLDRQDVFTDGEKALLGQLADSYSYCLQSLQRGAAGLFRLKVKPLGLVMALILAGLCFFPVKLSVTAPAEVIAHDPYVIAAPMDGVIRDVPVRPNQDVKSGDMLVQIDDDDLKNRVEITGKELAVSKAALDKASREAFSDPAKKAEIALLRAEVESQQAELSYTRSLLERSRITAPHDGIAIFNDPNDLRGAPVKTGQRVMLVARPDDTELLVRIPVDALIDIDRNVPVKFFLNIAPLDDIAAEFETISYEATPDADGLITYKMKASFADEAHRPRVGLKGTAKIYGPRTVLGYKILRRPLLGLRQILGL